MSNTLEMNSLRKEALRVLFVEDNPTDFELCLLELKKARLEIRAEVVQHANEFGEKLRRAPYDIVLADYRLAGWTGMDALKLLREQGMDTPLILVTGALGDEVAVECIKQGACDYVLKDRLSRLPVAIGRALHEKYLLDERKLAYEQLRCSEEKFRTLAETTASAIFIYHGTHCRYANRAAEVITGYTREELLALSSWDLIHPDSRDVIVQMGLSRVSGEKAPARYEVKIITKTGEARWLDLTATIIEVEGKRGGLITAFDITKHKEAEEEIRQLVASDPLTGLANHRRLLEGFDSELERSRRTGRSFALVLLDLDGLQALNDIHGYLVGSRALCRIANVLRAQCRSLDVPARYGGDEFAVILPETGDEEARHLAHRVAACVQNDGEQPIISVSFGLAVYPEDGETLEELMKIADGGLYLMKGPRNWRVPDSA